MPPASKVAELAEKYGPAVVAARNAGDSMDTTAAKLGVTRYTVREVLIYLGKRGAPGRAPLVERRSPDSGVTVTNCDDGSKSVQVNSQTIRTLDGLLVAADIDTSKWTVSDFTANKWDTSSVDRRTGDVRVVELWQVKAKLVPNVESLIEKCPPVPIAEIPRRPAGLPGAADETWVILPDTQHGFKWNANYTELIPMHDASAIDAARQVCEMLQPDGIALLGDHFDASAWSTFRQGAGEHFTSQPTLNALAWDLAELRRSCPTSKIVYVGGNHEARVEKRIVDALPELMVTSPVGSDVHPFSIPGLLRLADMGIEYIEYGDGWWLWGDLEITHEDGLDTMRALGKRSHSIVHGHTHRAVCAQRTIWGPDGRRTIYACSPGCLARVDAGAVPGSKSRQDWQQGIAIAQRIGGSVHLCTIPIIDGRAAWGGAVVTGRDRSDEIAAFSGYPQIAAWRRG